MNSFQNQTILIAQKKRSFENYFLEHQIQLSVEYQNLNFTKLINKTTERVMSIFVVIFYQCDVDAMTKSK